MLNSYSTLWARKAYSPAAVLNSFRNFLTLAAAILVAGALFLALFAPVGDDGIVLTELQKNCAKVAKQVLGHLL
jgi:hypothetical protein